VLMPDGGHTRDSRINDAILGAAADLLVDVGYAKQREKTCNYAKGVDGINTAQPPAVCTRYPHGSGVRKPLDASGDASHDAGPGQFFVPSRTY